MQADSATKASELFRSLPIAQIKEINESLEVQANDKTSQLRTLVGSKYRSLLLTAENIILMNSIVQEQDKKLAYLSDLNDTHGTTVDKVISNYQTYISLSLSESSKRQDTSVLFRILLLNLQFSLERLISTIEKSALERSFNGISALETQLIQTSKEFYLFGKLFENQKTNAKDNTLLVKFKQLKIRYQNFLDRLMVRSSSYSHTYLSNNTLVTVLVSLGFLLSLSLNEILNHYIQIKQETICKLFSSLHFLQLNNINNLKKTINYIYVSLNYLKVFFPETYGTSTRTFANVIAKNITISSPQFKTSLYNKYSPVLEKFENFDQFLSNCKFTYSLSDYKQEFKQNSSLHKSIDTWKAQLSEKFNHFFEKRLNHIIQQSCMHQSNPRNNKNNHKLFVKLIDLIKVILKEFKNIHSNSLTILTLPNGDDLLKKLIVSWKFNVSKIIENQIGQIQSVNTILKDYATRIPADSHSFNNRDNFYDGLWSLSENDLHIENVNSYLFKIASLTTANMDLWLLKNFNKTQQAFPTSSLPLILASLIDFFGNLKVVLLVLSNEFLKNFILRDFEKITTNNDNDELYSNDKRNKYNADFYNDNDFDIYQNMESVEKFLHSYKIYFLDAYRKIWDRFFNGLLFDSLNGFLDQTLELCGTVASEQQSSKYSLMIGILLVVLMFRKCISNQDFKTLIVNSYSSNKKEGENDKKLYSKQVKENLANTKRKTNQLVDYCYYHITAHHAIDLYNELNKLLLKRFLPLKDAALLNLSSNAGNAIDIDSKPSVLSFSQLPDLKTIDIETFTNTTNNNNNNNSEITERADSILQNLDYTKKFRSPLESEIWENGLPVLPSTDFTLLLFKYKKALVSGDYLNNNNNSKLEMSQSNLNLFRNSAFKKFKNHIMITLLLQFQQTLKLVENVYQSENKPTREHQKVQHTQESQATKSNELTANIGTDAGADAQAESSTVKGKEINNNSEGAEPLENANKLNSELKVNFASSSEIIRQKVLLSFADMCYLLKFISIDNNSNAKDFENLIASIKDLLSKIYKLASSSACASSATSISGSNDKTEDLFTDIDSKFVTRNISDYFNQTKLLYLPLSC